MEIDTLIGPKARFVGDLVFEGTLRIDGTLEGTIKAGNDAQLILSESARVKGEIEVPNVKIHGTIEGNVRAAKSLVIGATGRVTGDLEYVQLSIQEGASVNGRCVRIQPEQAKAPKAEGRVRPEPKAA